MIWDRPTENTVIIFNILDWVFPEKIIWYHLERLLATPMYWFVMAPYEIATELGSGDRHLPSPQSTHVYPP